MKRSVALRIFPAVALLLALLTVAAGHGPAVASAAATVEVLAATDEEIVFTLSVPAYEVDAVGEVTAAGLEARIQEPGRPALPYYTTYIALPPAADAMVTVREIGVQTVALANPVRPAPQVAVPDEDDIFALAGQLDELLYEEPDPAIYNQTTLFPQATYTLSEPVYARDLRLVSLALYPLRYNPAGQVLHHAQQLEVRVTFQGAEWDELRPAGSMADTIAGTLQGSILNLEQAQEWRSLPAGMEGGETVLPVGSDAYRIEVNQDGIYEVTFVDLAVAGMNVSAVNPNTFQMMYRGQPVAYEFIGNDNDQFENGEAIRFYGWDFDGSRLERQFIPDNRNYFWLWAGGTSTRIEDTTNPTNHPIPAAFPESITFEEDIYYQLTLTNKWPEFPNEPDAWYWAGMLKPPGSPPQTHTFPVMLPHPAATGSDAHLTAELLTRQDAAWTHDVEIYANGGLAYADGHTWTGRRNVNVEANTPLSTLVHGVNNINLLINTADNTGNATYYLNRITVDYERQFVAVNNQLIFRNQNGPHTFSISGYSEGDASKVIAWDITDRLVPQRIPMTAGNIGGSGPYVYTLGSDRTAGEYIATTTGNLLDPLAITRYDVPDIDPAGNGADWIAISHKDFIGNVNQLAAHRQNSLYGGLDTHIVDIDDVINQYGYGFPIPGAINAYLNYAMANWSPAPSYLLLVGDATLNPRQLPCDTTFSTDCTVWNGSDPNYVLTDIVFVDPYAGLITTDYTFSLLTDDLVPDIAVGRLAVQTTTEASNIIEKIIEYEQKHVAPQDWQANVLFVADAFDPSAGNFCAQNQLVGNLFPDTFNQIHKCLPANPTPADILALRAEMRQIAVIPPNGVTFMNYRGHGSIQDWGSGMMAILANTDTNWWYPTVGEPHPLVLISMDCLDGNFAYPGVVGLGEAFHKLDGAGSVAHWSSTGLGLTTDHTAMATGFYKALFEQGQLTIGAAINSGKIAYEQGNWNDYELYGFTLQGDPAMLLMRPDLELDKSPQQPFAEPGDTVSFTIQVGNNGLLDSTPTVVDTLPAGLTFVGATADREMTVSQNGNLVTMDFAAPLGRNESLTIQLTATIDPNFGGKGVTNSAVASDMALDVPGNNSDIATILMGDSARLYLPAITKP